jgi:hypothetical protein
MAADPEENGLSRNHANNGMFVLAGLALVLVFVAYSRLPTDYFTALLPTRNTGVGDSGGEHLRMERSPYDAWVHVGIAFFAEVAIVGVLLGLSLSRVPGLSATGDVVPGLAIVGAVGFTLWVYWDRWRCIEAYSSKYCSGCANVSYAYVPVLTFLYANYRAVRRLLGR